MWSGFLWSSVRQSHERDLVDYVCAGVQPNLPIAFPLHIFNFAVSVSYMASNDWFFCCLGMEKLVHGFSSSLWPERVFWLSNIILSLLRSSYFFPLKLWTPNWNSGVFICNFFKKTPVVLIWGLFVPLISPGDGNSGTFSMLCCLQRKHAASEIVITRPFKPANRGRFGVTWSGLKAGNISACLLYKQHNY